MAAPKWPIKSAALSASLRRRGGLRLRAFFSAVDWQRNA